jgi:hypothetical protein
MFEKIIYHFKVLYERYFGEYIPVREFDYKKAQEFFENNKNHLMDMAFCLGFDSNVYAPIMEDGEVIKPPICFSEVDGVTRTFYDVPCFSYRFKSGQIGRMYCFHEYEFNQFSNTYRYVKFFGVPQKMKHFGRFYESNFVDRYSQTYAKFIS